METKNEITGTVQYSSPQEDDLQAAYEKGRKVGRFEGMIAYQKHLIDNIQKENIQLVQKLDLQQREVDVIREYIAAIQIIFSIFVPK